MQTNPAVEQNKNIKWLESPWNQSGRNQYVSVNLCHLYAKRLIYSISFYRYFYLWPELF